MKSIRFTFLALLLAVQLFAQSSIKPQIIYGTDDPKGLDDVPVVFRVFQNYPNPYNPVTKIKFELFDYTDFKFKVFDVTGQEIYAVNDTKPAGTYEITFDGSGISSGLYFYSIEAKNYKVTKKMILIK